MHLILTHLLQSTEKIRQPLFSLRSVNVIYRFDSVNVMIVLPKSLKPAYVRTQALQVYVLARCAARHVLKKRDGHTCRS